MIISVLGGTSLGKNLARYSGISYGLSSGTWIHYICQFLLSPSSGSVLRVQFPVSVTPGVIDDWELSFAHHPSRWRTEDTEGCLEKKVHRSCDGGTAGCVCCLCLCCQLREFQTVSRILPSLPSASTICCLDPSFPPLLGANPNI